MDALPKSSSSRRPKVFVDGSEGTTGLLINERLTQRTDIELITIDSAHRKDPAARAAFLNAADVAFLCLPDDAAKEAVALTTNPSTILIDASTAHRVNPAWAYGLPELGSNYRESVRTSHRIANVGCHAAAFLLGVRPLVTGSLVPADWRLSTFSLTGYSGGGKKMMAAYESGHVQVQSPRLYALELNHKHLPEMRQHAGLKYPPIFNPAVGAFQRGLAVTVPLALADLPGSPSLVDIHDALSKAYRGEQFVRVLPLGASSELDGGLLNVEACNGTNRADVMVFGSGDRCAVIVRLDNLGKGASGSAIQCMNLRLGFNEATGLAT